MADYTKQEIETFAIDAPLTGYTPTTGTITSSNTVEQGIEINDGNLAVANTKIGALQSGNNLFNYYNFR